MHNPGIRQRWKRPPCHDKLPRFAQPKTLERYFDVDRLTNAHARSAAKPGNVSNIDEGSGTAASDRTRIESTVPLLQVTVPTNWGVPSSRYWQMLIIPHGPPSISFLLRRTNAEKILEIETKSHRRLCGRIAKIRFADYADGGRDAQTGRYRAQATVSAEG
jgi:hypothetical protein